MPAPEENNSAKKRKLEEVSAAETQLEAVRADAEMTAGRSDAAAKQEQQPIESQANGDEKEPKVEPKVEPEQKPAGDAAAALEVEKNTLRRLLEPFSREQLVEILTSAATQYDALYTELKAVAGADVAHRKVFVRGLAWETKTEHLKEAFAAFGDVQEGAVIYDKATGKSRGYGFVTFVDMEAAQRAIDKQSITIDGRKTTCNLAALRTNTEEHQQPPPQAHQLQMPPAQHQQLQQPGRSMAGPRPTPSHTVYTTPVTTGMYPMMGMPVPAQGVPLPPPQQQQQQGARHGGDDTADRKLFVRGLSWDSGDDALRREFQKFGELEEAMVARDRKTGKSKGYGFVTYKLKAAADHALQTPQKFIDGRTTFCNLACQGNSKAQGDRGGGQALMTPVAPSYAMPMAPVGMYAAMPYPGAAPVPSMPQQPLVYGQYPGMPSPYAQQPQAYAPATQYYQSRPQPPHQQLKPPAPPRR